MNITQLRNELIQNFKDIKAEKINSKIAISMNNTAGKILQTARIELDYTKHVKTARKIKFLES